MRFAQHKNMISLRNRGFEILCRAVDLILPPRCIVSGDIVEKQGMIAPHVWLDLNFIARPYCSRCGLPFEFEVEQDTECGLCLQKVPEFDKARAALKYDDLSRNIILGFKHADKTQAVKAFAPWLKRAGQDILDQTDILAPVPLHRWRLVKRRYNQAALMAAEFSKETGRPHIPDLLLRTRATASQGYMKEKARRMNVRKAFALHEKYRAELAGKAVLLVDDVYTTGATVNECAKVLKKAGARAVNVLTLAKVVKG